MIGYFTKAINQISDPAFRRIMLWGFAGALAALVLCFFAARHGLYWLADQNYAYVDGTLDFLARWGVVPVFLIAAYFLFPAFATMIIGAFLDDVVDAVEARHYPHARAAKPMGVLKGIWMGLRLGLAIVFWNILALPLYIALFFTAIGPFALYLVINGYLLGREYMELVSARHLSAKGSDTFRAQNRAIVLGIGVVGTGLFMIPLVNLIAPLILAAASVHGFHAKRD